MVERDWKRIVEHKLQGIVKEAQIYYDFKRLYDQSYGVLRKLVEYEDVKCWSQMKKVFEFVNKEVITTFENRYRNLRTG